MRIVILSCVLALSGMGSACASGHDFNSLDVDNQGSGGQATGGDSGAAAPTAVEVSVLANGAKFIGDKTGGAEVVIRDAATGEELARGIATGSTGDTGLIMDAKGGRHENVVTDTASVFRTEIALQRPRLVEVSVRGPLDHPIAETTASSRYWLLPGMHLEGDRRIVETLSGYIIDIREIAVNDVGSGRVRVALAMLCGCPISPDGRWDANGISKHASLVAASGVTETVELKYSGEDNIFIAEFAGKTRQPRRLEIRLAGKSDANTGFVAIPLLD